MRLVFETAVNALPPATASVFPVLMYVWTGTTVAGRSATVSSLTCAALAIRFPRRHSTS